MRSSSHLTAAASAGEQAATDSILLTMTGALALIIFVIVALAWLARRSGLAHRLNDGRETITLVASKSLGNRERVMVLDIQNQRLVLGVTATQITRLAAFEQPPQEQGKNPVSQGMDFPGLFKTVCKNYRKDAVS